MSLAHYPLSLKEFMTVHHHSCSAKIRRRGRRLVTSPHVPKLQFFRNVMQCRGLMQCKSPKTSQHPQKPRQGDQVISPALYQIQSTIAKLLVSLRCLQVKIRKGQAWGFGCTLPYNSALFPPSIPFHLCILPSHSTATTTEV